MANTVLSDYSTLIDAETFAFIERTDKWYPPDTVDYSIDRQREIYNAMCREFHQGYPAGIQAEDSFIETSDHSIGLRYYRLTRLLTSPAAIVVYFHGGGFVVGGLDSHDDVCAEICSRTGYEVVAVDYRLSPEHCHPAAFDDSLTAVKTIAESSALPLVLCGDSAGGNLAAAVVHATRDKPWNLVGQVLIYPGLGADITRGSYVIHAEAPMLTTRDVKFYVDIRQGEFKDAADATFAPLRDDSFERLPPTVVFSAECDPLCDDGDLYTSAVIAAGGQAHWFREAGMVHGYLRARSSVTRARNSFTRIIESLIMLGERAWHH